MTDWLIGTLLATSGLILLVLALREPVRRRFGSRVVYGLWLIPAARLLMPTLTETVERQVAAAPVPQPLVQPVVGEPLLLANVAPASPSLLEQAGGWPAVLITLWLGVAGGLFVSRVAAYRRDRAAILAEGREIGRIGVIRMIESAAVASPVAFGILDRVIAVPLAFDRLYQGLERRFALEHELAHHRSGDLIVNHFAFVLLCLQWFNPLAWAAHAAFRFDQEAACDARVLDKVSAGNRADYGRAIAKAASGRALLFASALDRPTILKRRLKSMLHNPGAGRSSAGKAMILAAIAVALPLTATRAVEYVDIPAPAAPESARAPKAMLVPAMLAAPAAAPVAPTPPVPPAAPLPPANHGLRIHGDTITIDGRTKRWKDLTPAEKAQVRSEVARAREELRNSRIDRAAIDRDVRAALAEVQVDREAMRRELAQARIEIEQAVREIDANAAEFRRRGVDPESIKAQVRASLKAVEAIDVEAITRQAMASVRPEAIAASLAGAEAALRAAEAELDRMEEQLERADDKD